MLRIHRDRKQEPEIRGSKKRCKGQLALLGQAALCAVGKWGGICCDKEDAIRGSAHTPNAFVWREEAGTKRQRDPHLASVLYILVDSKRF